MKLLDFILIFSTIATFSECRGVYNNARVNCFIRHLKSVQKLSEDFPEHIVLIEEDDCTKLIHETREESLSVFLSVPDLDGPCIVEGLKEKLWFEYGLLETVYDASQTLTKSEAKRKAKEVKRTGEKLLSDVGSRCETPQILDALFDDFFKKKPNSDKDTIDNYCARKLAVDKSLIDTSKFNIVLNPKNADVSDVNCDEINSKNFKKFQEEFIEGIKEGMEEEDETIEVDTECVLKKFNEAKFTDEVVKVLVLSEIEITETQKENAKSEFVKALYKTFSEIPDCQVKKVVIKKKN